MKNLPFSKRASFAWKGISGAFRDERSFRTQAAFALLACAALLILRPAPMWWALIGLMMVLVLAAELINTALENLADHLHPDEHPKIGLAKDCAAGAVLLLSAGAVWVALMMIIDELF